MDKRMGEGGCSMSEPVGEQMNENYAPRQVHLFEIVRQTRHTSLTMTNVPILVQPRAYGNVLRKTECDYLQYGHQDKERAVD